MRLTRARLPGLVSAVMVALLWAAPSGHAASQDVGVVVTGWATPIERQVDLASRLDAGWISFGVVWWRYETTPRSYTRPGHPDRERWTQLGEELAAAKARGLKVSVTFFRPPPWARASDDERAGPAAGRVDDFVRFVDDVARTYGEDIDAYATWNEPNIDQFWRGPDPVAYARLHRAAAGRISAVDPSASIILGPFAGNAPNALGFVSAVYARGVRGTVDRLGWNVYPATAPWVRGDTATLDGVRLLAPLLRRVDPGRRVWIGELGWSTCACGSEAFNVVSPPVQADYLLSALSYTRRYLRGLVDRTSVYSLADGPNRTVWAENHGLVRYDFRPKPAYRALVGARRELSGPGVRWRRSAVGSGGAVRGLRLVPRRGVIRVSARLALPSSGRVRVFGYWRGRWRPLTSGRAGAGRLSLSIEDRGFRAIRVMVRGPRSGWVVAQMPVPSAPRISTTRARTRT